MARSVTSVEPPAATPTTSVIGDWGTWAAALSPNASATAMIAAAPIIRIDRFDMTSPLSSLLQTPRPIAV